MNPQEILNKFMSVKAELLLEKARRVDPKNEDFYISALLWTDEDENNMLNWPDDIAEAVLEEMKMNVKTLISDQHVCPYCVRQRLFAGDKCIGCHFQEVHGKCGSDGDDHYSLYSDVVDFTDICNHKELREIFDES